MWHMGSEVDLSELATWHVGGAHMSGQYGGGATWLKWTNGVLTRGTEVAQ
jgi:hypothetical protein